MPQLSGSGRFPGSPICALVVLLSALSEISAQETVFTAQGSQQQGSRNFGYSLDVLGDVDQDGFDELLVGDPGDLSTPGSGVGRVWVLSGKDGHPIHVLRGTGNFSWGFGRSIAALSDLNGDGVSDFAVAPGGHGYVTFFSGKDASVIRHQSIQVRDLSNGGDLNEDGVHDLLALSGRGFVAISGLDGSILIQSNPPDTVPRVVAIASVGDLDQDGIPDLASASGGRISVISGRTRRALWTRSYSGPIAICEAGDMDMDGVSEVALGLPQFSTLSGDVGAVQIYSGRTGAELRIILGPAPRHGVTFSQFGGAVSGAGDVNGDGHKDLLVGAYQGENPQGALTGFARMVSGLDGSEIYTLYGDGESDYFGYRVLAGFDLQRDGFLDFAASSTRGSVIQGKAGTGYVRLYTEVQPTYTPFGTGCPGSVGTPTLSVVDPPQVGSRFSIRVQNLAPLQLGVVFTGFSDTEWHEMNSTLPLELGYLGMPGCHLLVSPDIHSVASSVLGTSTWGFDIPELPELYGLEFFNQAFFLDPGANAANVVGSNAGRGKIGS